MVGYNDSVHLVLHCQGGDRQSLEELARVVRERLWGYLCRMACDDDLADEIMQEILLTVVQKIKHLHRPDKFWPWVAAIARNKVRDHYQKNYKRNLAESEFTLRLRQKVKLRDSFQVQLEQREMLRQIYISGQRLSGVYARILELRCFSSKSYSEIAAIMGGSCQNACVRLHRARKLLCKRLSIMAEEYC